MNSTQTSTSKILSQRRARLEAKLQEIAGSLQDRSELSIEQSADVIDMIRTATDRDLAVQRFNLSAQTLSDVRAALNALGNDDYGICQECDEEIAPRRLDVIPWARFCVRCQEVRDSRAGESEDLSLLEAA